MMRVFAVASLCALVWLSPDVVHAHHSFAMFDFQKSAEVKGTVTAFLFTNPHVRLDVVSIGDDGSQAPWSFEGGGTMEFMRAGIYGKDLKPGDKVVVHHHPLKDGRPGGFIVDIVKDDGRVLRQKVGS